MSTCNPLDLESLGSWPTMSKNFPGTALDTHKSLAFTLEYCIPYFATSEEKKEAILNSKAYVIQDSQFSNLLSQLELGII